MRNNIRKAIVFIVRSLSYLFLKIKTYLCTIIFRITLWIHNVRFGKNVVAAGGVLPIMQISPNADSIVFGNNLVFHNYNDAGWYSKCSIWVKSNAFLSIGNNTGLNGVLVYASKSITIGSNVNIGGSTRIFDTDFHSLDYLDRRAEDIRKNSKPIVIEDDVFIGTNCIILKGVKIGERSIVAAGSVVTKDIPKDEMWGGNPAKFIKKID